MPDILRYFEYMHLRHENLRQISGEFYSLAHLLQDKLPESEQKQVMFQKLLEAKDAAVRAALEDGQ